MENCQVNKNKSLTISTAKTADITNTEHLFSWKHYIENKQMLVRMIWKFHSCILNLKQRKKATERNYVHYKNIF